MGTVRYFEGEHPGLVERLEAHFSRVRERFLEAGWRGALVLGGGYGRGEGGVMEEDGEEAFCNDLDYFLFDDAPGNPRLAAWCREIERTESGLLGIDVEIKCLRAASLGDVSRSMMFADLVAGHVVVAGDAGFLEKLKVGLDFSRIEEDEAARLLWNRGSGIFFAACRMGEPEGLAFVIRNHAKLKLALGDAWLCLHGLYSPKCRERGARLAGCGLPGDAGQLAAWHAEGVEFKFRPFSSGPSWEQLEEESGKLIRAWRDVYLAVEAKRLGIRLVDFRTYLALPRILRDGSVFRNLTLAVRDRLQRGAHLRPLGDYPRAALMRALPCLLGLTPGGVAEAARFLPAPGGDAAQARNWEPIYRRWWSCYA